MNCDVVGQWWGDVMQVSFFMHYCILLDFSLLDKACATGNRSVSL
jgi:hypothetical protein